MICAKTRKSIAFGWRHLLAIDDAAVYSKLRIFLEHQQCHRPLADRLAAWSYNSVTRVFLVGGQPNAFNVNDTMTGFLLLSFKSCLREAMCLIIA